MAKSTFGGKKLFLYFFLFFGFVMSVNAVFIYSAIKTHSGTVADNAYEKGLNYNTTLHDLKKMPALHESASLENNIFRWTIRDEKNLPLVKANAKVIFFRPVKDGTDFEVKLVEAGPGIYEAKPGFPVKGLWTAQLDAKWNSKQYRSSQTIIVK